MFSRGLWEAKLYQTLGGKTLPNIFGSRVGHPKNKQSRAFTSNSRAITAAGTWRCAGVVAAVVVVVVVAAVAVLYFFTSFLLFFFTNWFTSWQQLVITNKRISQFHGISYHELVVTCGNGFHAREIQSSHEILGETIRKALGKLWGRPKESFRKTWGKP